jgi:hypothetical protein
MDGAKRVVRSQPLPTQRPVNRPGGSLVPSLSGTPSADQSLLHFYRVVPTARPPARADRAGGGTLPTRATRYCEALTTATGFGWHVFPPLDFHLLWDGAEIFWRYPGVADWLPLDAVQFPGLSAAFDRAAPDHLQGCAPPFLTALPEPGLVQIWTGLFVRTAPGWAILVRPPANLPPRNGCALYEGIVETDHWFGPLFSNLRLTRTDVPVRLGPDTPLLQVQALPRTVFADTTVDAVNITNDLTNFKVKDWQDYQNSVVDPHLRPGRYAVATRRRRAADERDLRERQSLLASPQPG